MKCYMHLLKHLNWFYFVNNIFYINYNFSKINLFLNKNICEHMISFGIHIMTNTNNLGKGHTMFIVLALIMLGQTI